MDSDIGAEHFARVASRPAWTPALRMPTIAITEGPAASRQRSLHWNGVYGQRNETEVSWFEPQPTCSVSLLEALGVRPAHSLIDVGAGAARLVDLLLRRGFVDLTVLDVSRTALRQAQRRLGPGSRSGPVDRGRSISVAAGAPVRRVARPGGVPLSCRG